MFDGRISFDGIATPPKTFGSWILFPPALQVKQKTNRNFVAVIAGRSDTYGLGAFPQARAGNGKTDSFDLLVLF
jgi:hypothetical protein